MKLASRTEWLSIFLKQTIALAEAALKGEGEL
jgi:hypothetical protein